MAEDNEADRIELTPEEIRDDMIRTIRTYLLLMETTAHRPTAEGMRDNPRRLKHIKTLVNQLGEHLPADLLSVVAQAEILAVFSPEQRREAEQRDRENAPENNQPESQPVDTPDNPVYFKLSSPLPPIGNSTFLAGAPGMLKEAISYFWPSWAWEQAAKIAYCEGGYREDAYRNDDGEESKGTFQINVRAHPDLDARFDLMTFWGNAEAAYRIWINAGSQWHDWYCCALLHGLLDPSERSDALDKFCSSFGMPVPGAAPITEPSNTDREAFDRAMDDIRNRLGNINDITTATSQSTQANVLNGLDQLSKAVASDLSQIDENMKGMIGSSIANMNEKTEAIRNQLTTTIDVSTKKIVADVSQLDENMKGLAGATVTAINNKSQEIRNQVTDLQAGVASIASGVLDAAKIARDSITGQWEPLLMRVAEHIGKSIWGGLMDIKIQLPSMGRNEDS